MRNLGIKMSFNKQEKTNKKALLGKRLRDLRKQKGYNQEELAEIINVDPTTISNIENGKNYPSLSNLENILEALDSSFIEAFDFEHKKDNKDLILEINKKMSENPQKIEDFYKIIVALTK